MKKITLNRNTIYYLDEYYNIQETFVYQPKKLKINEAKQYLTDNGIEFNSLLKVLLDEFTTEVPKEYLTDDQE